MDCSCCTVVGIADTVDSHYTHRDTEAGRCSRIVAVVDLGTHCWDTQVDSMPVVALVVDKSAAPVDVAAVQSADMLAAIARVAVVEVGKAQVESRVRLMVVSHAHDSLAPRPVHTLVECVWTAFYVQIAAYRGLILAPYIPNPRLF